ncbi:MAG TPA: acyltransferase [Mucilaginibacter sp.]|nr:acyltransferase [Mucilaginibacter sp.]
MTFLKRTISPPDLKHTYSMRVEQYRGVCALLVLLAHGSGDEGMLVSNFRWPNVIHYFNAGLLSVMVFFCISGYVIGLNYDRNKIKIKEYLKKRAIRLFPIYLFALVICVLVAGFPQWYVLLGNALFLQSDQSYFGVSIPIFVNYPAWSLNFEVVYYLAFIAVFFLRPTVWKMLLIMAAVTVLALFTGDHLVLLSDYVNGFYFWILGLMIAWKTFDTTDSEEISVPFFSILFLHMSLHHLNVGEIAMHLIGIHTLNNTSWLFNIPFSLMVMCTLTGRNNTFLKFNKILCYCLPAMVFLYLGINHRLTEDTRWVMCLIFWILSLIFYFEKRVSGFVLDKLTGLGKISYALYLIHVPVAKLIKKTIYINNQGWEVVVKYSLWITITFGLAYLLERRLQPAIKKYFTSKPV